DPRSSGDAGRGSDRPVRLASRSTGVPRARHQLSSQPRRRLGQPDRRLPGRNGLGASLRAAAGDGRARRRSRAARRRRCPPPDLPGGPRPRSRSRAAVDERSSAAIAVVPGARGFGRSAGAAYTAAAGTLMAGSFDLSGRTAVVVGGTTGIGRAIAIGLAEAGADVVATGRRLSAVETAADQIEAQGRRTLRIAADVGNAASLRALRDAVLSTFTTVDIVVAAAGITKRVPTLEMAESDWSAILDTNVTGMFRTYQTFAPAMIARGRGRLIGVGSLASFVGLMEVAAYTASKAAVAGLTRALAVE